MSETLRQELVELAHYCHGRGWALATSGNFSAKSPENRIWITASGKDKSRLTPEDLVEITANGDALGPLRPSAETRLHCDLYKHFPDVHAVIHTHSPYSTILSRWNASRGSLELSGYEMLKALRGVSTHEHTEVVHVFPNNQDISALSHSVLSTFNKNQDIHAFLIESHGLYTWGRDVQEAKRNLEAFEFLFECEYRASARRLP